MLYIIEQLSKPSNEYMVSFLTLKLISFVLGGRRWMKYLYQFSFHRTMYLNSSTKYFLHIICFFISLCSYPLWITYWLHKFFHLKSESIKVFKRKCCKIFFTFHTPSDILYLLIKYVIVDKILNMVNYKSFV